jgi:hypothetical protein
MEAKIFFVPSRCRLRLPEHCVKSACSAYINFKIAFGKFFQNTGDFLDRFGYDRQLQKTSLMRRLRGITGAV